MINVLWGLLNLFAAYLLLIRVGAIDLRQWDQAGVFGLGLACISIQLSIIFGKVEAKKGR